MRALAYPATACIHHAKRVRAQVIVSRKLEEPVPYIAWAHMQAMIEGLGILLTRMTAPPPAPPMMEMPPGAMPQPGACMHWFTI